MSKEGFGGLEPSKGCRDIITIINSVGFPIVAFLLMTYICYSSLERMNKTIQINTQAMGEFSASFKTFQGQVMLDHKEMMSTLRAK